MKGIFVLLVVCLCALVVVSCGERLAAPSKENRKQLAGPPEEFASMQIPSPAAAALRADSTLVPFTLVKSNGVYTWNFQYPVDTPEAITVSVLSPFTSFITFYLQSPGDADYVKIDKSVFEGPLSTGKSYHSSSFGIDGNVVPSNSYVFYNPKLGFWNIKMVATSIPNPPANSPHGYLILDNISPYKLSSQLTGYNLEVGQEIGVSVHMSHDPSAQDADVNDNDPLPVGIMQEVIVNANLNILLPNGKEVAVRMHDNGMGLDAVSGDSIYTGSIIAADAGNYVFNPIISGNLPEGTHFLRSTSHLVAVSAAQMSLTGQANAVYDQSSKIVTFNIQVALESGVTKDTVRAYSEVWGTKSSDKTKLVPIAWVEAMVDSETTSDGKNILPLQLNENWIVKAGASSPFTLRNVVVQDRETNSILTQRTEIPVVGSASTENSVLSIASRGPQPDLEITEAMKYGPRPAKYSRVETPLTADAAAPTGKLILVHGYCSGDVWPIDQFTDALKFEDYSKSRSQDQFALLIRKFAEETHGLSSFSIVSHSQGGMAGLHLKSYYWSGLDAAASNGRLLQSVGTPYKGCSLAGTLADLGGLFGVGCSSNADLAPSGAQLWLSKVPKDPQDQVYYYNTQYNDSWFLSPACITASGLVLFSPNDGTCENKFSQPDKGGNNMGMLKSWCHISGMNYPAQTTDKARNTEMNQKAAR